MELWEEIDQTKSADGGVFVLRRARAKEGSASASWELCSPDNQRIQLSALRVRQSEITVRGFDTTEVQFWKAWRPARGLSWWEAWEASEHAELTFRTRRELVQALRSVWSPRLSSDPLGEQSARGVGSS